MYHPKTWFSYPAIFLVVGAVALLATTHRSDPAAAQRFAKTPPRPSLTKTFQSGSGQELVLIILGSARCGASRGSELTKSIFAVRDSARLIANRQGMRFRVVGVAIDDDI